MFAFRANGSNARQKKSRAAVMARVIGIDPGLRNLGWGVIDVAGPRIAHVANGTIRSAGDTLAERLLSLHRQLSAVLATHAPTEAAVEQTFVNKDGLGTLKLGQARGIALLVPAQAGLTVGEYAPNTVKKTVVGVGHADKVQVLHMVCLQLPGAKIEGPDAADALAIAICHAHHGGATGLGAALARAGA
jgi:crossover junction endodeoxyribonuclease RuvC